MLRQRVPEVSDYDPHRQGAVQHSVGSTRQLPQLGFERVGLQSDFVNQRDCV